jgi:hypothetical protein
MTELLLTFQVMSLIPDALLYLLNPFAFESTEWWFPCSQYRKVVGPKDEFINKKKTNPLKAYNEKERKK